MGEGLSCPSRSLCPQSVRLLTLFLFSSGVGDGGNELGMGKVKKAVKKFIRNGDVIACDVEADFAVIAGEYLGAC